MVLNLGESKVPVSLETFRQAWFVTYLYICFIFTSVIRRHQSENIQHPSVHIVCVSQELMEINGLCRDKKQNFSLMHEFSTDIAIIQNFDQIFFEIT